MSNTDKDKNIAPFTDKQVADFNKSQSDGITHGYTCCSPDDIPECKRTLDSDCDGKLVATNECLVCPCGKYKQNWFW